MGCRLDDSRKGRCLLILAVSGIAAVLIELTRCTPLPWGPFALMPGHVAVAMLPLGIVGLTRGQGQGGRLFAGAAGIAAAQFAAMIAHAEGEYRTLDVSGRIHWALLGLAAALAVALVVFSAFRASAGDGETRPELKKRVAAVVALGLTILAFRLSHVVLTASGVPNRERSLIIQGAEIHHIVIGSLGAYLLGLILLIRPRCARRNVIALLTGVLFGTIADQVVYYSLAEVSDVAYGSPLSAGGAVAFGIIYGGMILAYYERARSVERGQNGSA